MFIKPTIGRDVLYNDGVSTQRCTAKVCYVHSDNMINIGGFTSNGIPFSRTSVLFVQEEEQECLTGQAEWMTWQKEQAAKAEQADNLVPKVG